jgi:hypothetical protein
LETSEYAIVEKIVLIGDEQMAASPERNNILQRQRPGDLEKLSIHPCHYPSMPVLANPLITIPFFLLQLVDYHTAMPYGQQSH